MPNLRRTAAATLLAALAGCATTPPEEWVCDAEGPCYRVAAAPYRPYYGAAYGVFGFGYWSRPYYYYGVPAAPGSGGAASGATPETSRGINPSSSTRRATPGRVQPFGKSRSAR